jgi:hypothetical protein
MGETRPAFTPEAFFPYILDLTPTNLTTTVSAFICKYGRINPDYNELVNVLSRAIAIRPSLLRFIFEGERRIHLVIAFIQGFQLWEFAKRFQESLNLPSSTSADFYTLLDDNFEDFPPPEPEIPCSFENAIEVLPIAFATAYLGASKCFKRLLENDLDLPETALPMTLEQATIAGGSVEIIRMLQARKYPFRDNSLWVTALKYRRANLFVWLLKKKSANELSQLVLTRDLWETALKEGLEEVIDVVKKGASEELQGLIKDL